MNSQDMICSVTMDDKATPPGSEYRFFFPDTMSFEEKANAARETIRRSEEMRALMDQGMTATEANRAFNQRHATPEWLAAHPDI